MQKGGAQNEHQVDAISGGTKTCDGVNAMLETSIGKYESFLRAESHDEADVEECCGECCAEEVATEECCGECCGEAEEATDVEPNNVVEE
jgi:hypothetical protein